MREPIISSSALMSAVQKFEEAFGMPVTDREITHHRMVAAIHQLCVAIREAEMQGVSQEQLEDVLRKVRELHSLSPFVKRLQTWPRGYPGDFETIEYIISARPAPSSTRPEHYVEHHCLRDISAQQHRNKIGWQARACLEASLRNTECSILSIACGGSGDLRSIQDLLKLRRPKILLNDIDEDALKLSVDSLPELREAVTTLHGDVFNAVRRFKPMGPFHLILAGGLFDYLEPRQIQWLLPKLYSLLAPHGKLCFTNVADGNPDRVWLHHIANWKLVERSQADILQSLTAAGIHDERNIVIERDATGLTYLVTVTASE